VGIQQIPLSSGLITQADGEDVGINGCTELINAEFDKPGIIYKRKGAKTAVDTNKTFIAIFRWVNSRFTNDIAWIALDSAGEVWYSAGTSANLASWTTLTDLNVSDARIYNHGTFLRVAGGTTVQPRIIQSIDRNFFYTDTTTSLYSYDALNVGLPPKYPTTFTIIADATYTKLNQGGGGNLPFATTAKTCYYKITPVFDGNQELPFRDEYKAFSLTANDPPNSNVQIRLGFNDGAGDWDPRITSINLYRAITDGHVPEDSLYQKINTFETTQSTATDWINGTGETGKRVFSGGVAIDSDATTSHKLYWHATQETVQKTTTLSGSGNKRDIDEVHANHLYLGADFDGSTDDWGTTKYWEIRNETNLAPNYDMTSPYTDGWTFGGSSSYISEESSGYTGGNSVKMYGAGGSHWVISDDYIALNKNGTTYTIKCFIKYTRLNSGYPSSNSAYLKVYDGSSYVTIETKSLGYTAGFTEFSGQYTTTSDAGFKVQIGTDSGSAGEYTWVDTVEVNEVIQAGSAVYSGDNVFALEGSVSGTDGAVDKVAKVGGTGNHIIVNNITDVFKVNATPFGTPSSAILITSAGDQWSQPAGDAIALDTFDTGFVAGAYHPLAGVGSTEVNYKYSVITDGRQFVAGVRLDPNAYTGSYEDHDNWVIFSELNQYDILPISNYIQLRDMQGGAIVGLSSLMGDLVVFMERGIYRLSVPSSDPTAWSLSESEENIGCISDKSITPWESGIFFAGKDHLYFLDSNFRATPVTKSIKDAYQAVNSSVTTFYDVKKNRLLMEFGATNDDNYSLDLSSFPEERWTKVSGDMDMFTLDENLNLYSYDGATQLIKKHDGSKDETTSFKRTTGWISQANLDKSGVLRRLNLKYKSGDAITAKIYIDGDDSTVVATVAIPVDTSGADWYKWKPNVRCRSYKIELSTSASTNDVEIRRIEVEFE
jgi:hypothetical protein